MGEEGGTAVLYRIFVRFVVVVVVLFCFVCSFVCLSENSFLLNKDLDCYLHKSQLQESLKHCCFLFEPEAGIYYPNFSHHGQQNGICSVAKTVSFSN